MGFARDWLTQMGVIFDGMSHGDPGSFIGIPGTTRVGTGSGAQSSTGTGTGGTGTGSGRIRSGHTHQDIRGMLEDLYHQQYGEYPKTDEQFETWLRHNW